MPIPKVQLKGISSKKTDKVVLTIFEALKLDFKNDTKAQKIFKEYGEYILAEQKRRSEDFKSDKNKDYEEALKAIMPDLSQKYVDKLKPVVLEMKAVLGSYSLETSPKELTLVLTKFVNLLLKAYEVNNRGMSQKIMTGSSRNIEFKQTCNKSTHGYFQVLGARGIFFIVHSLTAVRNKPVAFKTYLRTACHEFIHYYDVFKLNIKSLHTKNFGERTKLLYNTLLQVVE